MGDSEGHNEEDGNEEGEQDEGQEDNAHQQMAAVNSLVGQPLPGDELLYALPVLAPYQTLQAYKFKVKMVPGTTKRGKAGKTVLFNFIADRTTSAREKDLIKALKDQDVARNFPGKVKIYATNSAKATTKKGSVKS